MSELKIVRTKLRPYQDPVLGYVIRFPESMSLLETVCFGKTPGTFNNIKKSQATGPYKYTNVRNRNKNIRKRNK